MRVALACALALGAAACSEDPAPRPRPAGTLRADSPYEAKVVGDGANGLWSLRDADGLRPRDQVADLTGTQRSATVVGGTIAGTTGPSGARGALFLRGGRIVTPLTTGFTSADAFTLEMGLRADACVTAWGRVAGTTALTANGREGMEVLHFPSQFQINPCRFGVEFWHRGKHLGGCHPERVPVLGRWMHLAVVYARGRVTCYEDGAVVESTALTRPAVFDQPGPLGIGGSGSGFQGPLDGASLSEVAVYPKALTAAEVRAHAALLRSAPVAGSPTGSPKS